MDVLGYQVFDRLVRRKQSRCALRSLGSGGKRPAAPELDVPSANSQEARQFITALRPDVLVVHATGLLKPETFTLARIAINLHCGILPRYRGHDTIFWALANNDSECLGATIHLIDAGADTGGVLKCCPVERRAGDTDITLWVRSFAAGVGGLMEVLRHKRFDATGTPTGRYPHWPHRGLSDYLKYYMHFTPGNPRA